ncbi:efflux RND transporter periplasmic adaptor subunit [Reinekea blandensis]|uniref:Efflux transporter, RND family, MFP subunit n=1 Tax=Reinekea blandensis MED297 TaxID=314283 RepID=A4BIR6_9GAMM|nr:efflux RND transporter periplasmic adaptor subunit [Reinekea blandensis]EAR08030.1 efflux transporter, RND family, MFP subunit [Reinekea sp. MED297] [Reinekea blandensis MED297]
MSKHRLAGPAIAIVITIIFVIWMLSGQTGENSTPTTSQAEKSLLASVQVVTSTSRPVEQSLEINGITEARRAVSIRSEASGKVTSLQKRQGDSVGAGDVIAQLDLQDLPARLTQAEAYENQTRLEYEGAVKLRNQGLQNETTVARALATYEQAKAQLAGLRLQRNHTTVRAPFAGRLENMDLELGSFVSQGERIADVYDYSQLTFVGAVAEKDIRTVSLGQTATVQLITGESLPARVSFIGSVANPATRTFPVELTTETASRQLSGITSTGIIALDDTAGHHISPALLYINDDGEMGLKVLNENDQVEFRPVEIIRSGTDGVWVSGLSDREKIIIVGQGFVTEGDETIPTYRDFNPDVAVGL